MVLVIRMILTILVTVVCVLLVNLLQNQFRIGLSRMERVVRERMSIQDTQYDYTATIN